MVFALIKHIYLKNSVWLTLGSEDETMFVTLRTFSARLPVKLFKTLNDRQSPIFSVHFA